MDLQIDDAHDFILEDEEFALDPIWILIQMLILFTSLFIKSFHDMVDTLKQFLYHKINEQRYKRAIVELKLKIDKLWIERERDVNSVLYRYKLAKDRDRPEKPTTAFDMFGWIRCSSVFCLLFTIFGIWVAIKIMNWIGVPRLWRIAVVASLVCFSICASLTMIPDQ